MDEQIMKIDAEQQKLLANATRIQIIYLLKDKALTAKQVADVLKKTPGSVHYHIQLLYKGGIIELVETKVVNGIVEKYFKSKAAKFSSASYESPVGKKLPTITGVLQLNEEQLNGLMKDIEEILGRWVEKSMVGENQNEIAVEFKFTQLDEKEDK